MTLRTEIETKHEQIRQFMHGHHLDGVLMTSTHNFAWFTGGGSNYVNTATECGAAHLLVTANSRVVICNNIEAARLMGEEDFSGLVDFEQHSWHDHREESEAIRKHTAGKRLACDIGMPGLSLLPADFDLLRHTLVEDEIARYREICRDTGEALGVAARSAKPGQTEHEIAGIMACEMLKRALLPIVLLVAADDRINRYRHPLPTSCKMTRSAEMVICARRKGLVSAATRIVHYGKLPQDLARRHEAVMKVDAAAILASKPGRPVREVFEDIRAMYARTGFPDEWKLHHQGGLIGYQPREYIAGPADAHTVRMNQAFAWNPSITGTKSEDTILITEYGPEVLTTSPDWPQEEIIVADRAVSRPEILVR